MKLTKENIETLPVSDKEKRYLLGDLEDIREINEICKEELFYLYWENQHTEYSAERTDPCPDYYGTYSVRTIEDNELIGLECWSEEELQDRICDIYDTCEYLMGRK